MKNKFLKKRRIIPFFVVLILITSYFIYINWPKEITPPGTVLTEKSLERDLEILGGPDSVVSPIYFGNADFLMDEEKIRATKLQLEDQIVKLRIQNKKQFSKPYEVEYAMRVWLYLRERTSPISIKALNVFAYKGGLTGRFPIIITKAEFEELYNENSQYQSMDESDIVHNLTQKWIEKHQYSRVGLE